MLAQIGLDRDTLKGVAAKLSWEELLAMEDGCRRRAAERYPLLPLSLIHISCRTHSGG